MPKLAFLVAVFGCLLPVTTGIAPAESSVSARSHYERPVAKGGPYKERVIVFVHGIFGDAKDTWTYAPTNVYWPKILLSDPTFNDSDVYVASYDSPYFGNAMNVAEVAKNLKNRLVNDEVFLKHREVVFVCHSLGGLVVQQLLLMYREFAKQVPFVYFFSTPESGAQIASLGSIFSSDPLLSEMFSGDENGYLQSLEDDWRAAHFHIHRLCAYEKKKYRGVLVVSRLSSTRNCDEPALPINEDHLGIVKPDGIEHDSYLALRNAVKEYPIAPIPSIPTPKKSTSTKNSRTTPTPAQPTYSVTDPSGSIVNQNSPNYGEQTINNAPPSRVLDAEHAGKFRAALVGTRGTIWIFTDGTDQDVLPLASQLCGLFKEERHAVNCVGVPGSPTLVSPQIKLPAHLVGLHCYEVDAASLKAFNDAGLECIYESGRLGEPEGPTIANAIAVGNEEREKAEVPKRPLRKAPFRESPDYFFSVGNNSMTLVPDRAINVFKGVSAVLRDSEILVSAELFAGSYAQPVKVKDNQFELMNSGWDINSDDSAFEVVNDELQPMLQIIYTTPHSATLYGIFSSGQQLTIMSRDGLYISANQPLADAWPLKRLFKYPSRKYRGEELADP